MKKLLVLGFSLFLFHAVEAAPLFSPDSSRILAKAKAANVLAKEGVRDTFMVPITEPVKSLNYQGNNIYMKRLDSIQKDVPLDYNEYVQSYIDLYLSSPRREGLGRVLGLTKYYFPIYEKAFRDAGIPDEIKYLSIVESQLDANAISRVGATGPWQFMATTAKIYGLNMDSYVDERRDPIQSSYAAAAYLKDAYQEFGDWLLAIASYNCGKSNVIRAIELAGANDFWSIRQYLPVETRGYVPAYIAITYLMNYHHKYNIIPRACSFAMQIDTVSVNKYVSLKSVSRILNISFSQLVIMNPAYRQQMVNGTPESPKILVIPEASKARFGTMYSAMNMDMSDSAPVQNYASNTVTQPAETAKPYSQQVKTLVEPVKKKVSDGYISYRVQPGDTLSAIATKFGDTTMDEIKKLNGLKEEDLKPGMTIMVN